jgi:hypothetical protein
MGAKQYLRSPLFIILLIGLPPTFISLSFIVTPDLPFGVNVQEGAGRVPVAVGMADFHGAIMVPITVAFLSGILGLFVMLSARQGDRRLVIAGYSPNLLLVVRLVIVAVMSLVITAISVGVTLISFQPMQLGLFFLANLITALQYGFLGAIAGTFLSAMSGTYLMFFMPMMDVGFAQNPMFDREHAALWVKLLPSYAPMEVLIDGAFTASFDTGIFLLLSLLYCLAIALVAGILFHRVVAIRH